MGKIVNKASYLLSYMVQGVFSATLGTYLPIYLQDELSVGAVTLSIISFLAYFPLVLKPALAILGDQRPLNGYKRKYWVIIGTASFIICCLIAGNIPTDEYIILFTAIITLGYFAVAMFDANLDGLMVDTLIRSKQRIPTVVLFMIFSQFGTMLASFAFGFASDIGSVNQYLFMFTFCGILAVILHLLTYWLNEPRIGESEEESVNEGDDAEQSYIEPHLSISRTFIIASIIFALFLNADKMSDWVIEPYITDRFGSGAFLTYNDWIAFFSMFTIVGYLVALFLAKRKDPNSVRSQKVLIILLIAFAVYYIMFPFLTLNGLIIITAAIVLAGGMAMIQFIDLFMVMSQRLKTNKKGAVYQVYLAMFTLGKLVARPLGTFLTSWIPAGTVILLCAVPMLISSAALWVVSKEIIKK